MDNDKSRMTNGTKETLMGDLIGPHKDKEAVMTETLPCEWSRVPVEGQCLFPTRRFLKQKFCGPEVGQLTLTEPCTQSAYLGCGGDTEQIHELMCLEDDTIGTLEFVRLNEPKFDKIMAQLEQAKGEPKLHTKTTLSLVGLYS